MPRTLFNIFLLLLVITIVLTTTSSSLSLSFAQQTTAAATKAPRLFKKCARCKNSCITHRTNFARLRKFVDDDGDDGVRFTRMFKASPALHAGVIAIVVALILVAAFIQALFSMFFFFTFSSLTSSSRRQRHQREERIIVPSCGDDDAEQVAEAQAEKISWRYFDPARDCWVAFGDNTASAVEDGFQDFQRAGGGRDSLVRVGSLLEILFPAFVWRPLSSSTSSSSSSSSSAAAAAARDVHYHLARFRDFVPDFFIDAFESCEHERCRRVASRFVMMPREEEEEEEEENEDYENNMRQQQQSQQQRQQASPPAPPPPSISHKNWVTSISSFCLSTPSSSTSDSTYSSSFIVAIGCEDWNSYIYHYVNDDEASSPRLIKKLAFHWGGVSSVAFFCPGGARGAESAPPLLATGSRDGVVAVWDLDDAGVVIKELNGHDDAVTCVRWSADGQVLCSASEDGTIRLWRLGLAASTPAPVGGDRGGDEANAVAVAGGGAAASAPLVGADAAATPSPSPSRGATLAPHTPERQRAHAVPSIVLRGHSDAVVAVDFLGHQLISASTDGSLKIWSQVNEAVEQQAERVARVTTNVAVGAPILALAVSPGGGGLIAVGTIDGVISVRNARGEGCRLVSELQLTDAVRALAFVSSTTLAVAAGGATYGGDSHYHVGVFNDVLKQSRRKRTSGAAAGGGGRARSLSKDEEDDDDEWARPDRVLPVFHTRRIKALSFCGGVLWSGGADGELKMHEI